MSKIVTAPLVIAKREDGSDVYVYAGSPLPDGLASGEEKRLADFLGDESQAGETGPEQPGGNASLEEWQDFARSQGATDADLEGKSRNDLRDQFSQ